MNQFVGQIGAREVFSVTVESVVSRNTDFGPIYDHTMRTKDGDLIFWSASSNARRLEQGVSYDIKATIKDHLLNDQMGRQTIVLRVEETVIPARVPRSCIGMARKGSSRPNPRR